MTVWNYDQLLNPYIGSNAGATTKRIGVWWANDNVAGDGILNNDMESVGASAEDFNDSTEGVGFKFLTAASANANAGLKQTNEMFRREWCSYIATRFKISSTSDIRVFLGIMSDAGDIAGETTLNNFSGVGIGKRTGDTNWFTYRNDGDATEDRVDTSIPASTNFTTIEIELDNTSFRSKIGGITQTAQTTEIPSGSTQLYLILQIETGAGAAAKDLTLLPVYVQTGYGRMIA